MGVFLGLGHVELAPARLREGLGERARLLGREGDSDREATLVFGHRHHQQVGRGGLAVRRRSVECREVQVGQGVDQLARPVRAEVGVDHRVPAADRAVDAVDHRRREEFVVLAALVAGLDRRDRVPARARRHRGRSRHTHARPGPSGCRDPSRSSARRSMRCARPSGRPRGDARRRRRTRCADRGGVSRPSSSAWTRTAGTPVRAARSAIATRCRSLAWTPPGPIRLMMWRRPPGRAARRHASSRAGRSKKLPSAIAASIRGRSWRTGRPAPRLR